MRELLPFWQLIIEIDKQGMVSTTVDTHSSATQTSRHVAHKVFEDNASCIALAYRYGTRLCTKHTSLKWNHFNDQLHNVLISIVKLDTYRNWADILTWPFSYEKHEHAFLQKFILGWCSLYSLYFSIWGRVHPNLRLKENMIQLHSFMISCIPQSSSNKGVSEHERALFLSLGFWIAPTTQPFVFIVIVLGNTYLAHNNLSQQGSPLR
jgi:hypothetical protein